jgi:hypothetical protein
VPLPKFRIEGCQDRDGWSKFSMENSRDREDRRIAGVARWLEARETHHPGVEGQREC